MKSVFPIFFILLNLFFILYLRPQAIYMDSFGTLLVYRWTVFIYGCPTNLP